jgi:SAM-dependent methyltransferase
MDASERRVSEGLVHPNYAYVLAKCRSLCPGGRVLDYGCGGGHVVELGRQQSIDIYGVEAFYAGSNARQTALEKGLLGSLVLELGEGGSIPFEDGWFDLVISNQVFEHVEDLGLVLQEISRVLKPSGCLLTLFPAREVIREGHCGVPMIHWFSKNSTLRYPYMRLMRALGFGYFKAGKDQRTWAHEFIDWLDRFTTYRTYEEVQALFRKSGYSLQHIEEDYIGFRLQRLRLGWLAAVTQASPLVGLARTSCRRLASMVILATRA